MPSYKLTCNGSEINLNDGDNFLLQSGFHPPSAEVQFGLTGSLGLNPLGGEVTFETAQDRYWRFPVLVKGDSMTETRLMLNRLQQFVDRSSREDVFFEYIPSDSIPYRPTWGQGVYLYRIKAGRVVLNPSYGDTPPEKHINSDVELLIAPYTEGLLQYALDGTGGIFEDDIASDHFRGTAVFPATTNRFTNPIFQYDWFGDWDNGWTFGASLTAWQEKQPEFVLFGDASCGVVSIGSTSTMTQSITAANTNTHSISCFAKRKDEGTVDSNVVTIQYPGISATTYTYLGDDWYRLTATAAGIASAQDAGVDIQIDDLTVFVTGFQFEEAGAATPFCYGDMVGCTWASTLHASASSRTVGSLSSTPQLLWKTGRLDQGTIRMAVRWYYPSTFGSNQYLIDCGAWELYLRASDDRLVFTDGTNTITSGVLSIARGDISVIHLTFGQSGIGLYINGALVGSGGAGVYVTAAASTAMYFGSNSTPANHSCVTFLDLTFWYEIATATQVGNDYTDIYSYISSGDGEGQRVHAIPWFWTEDGGDLDLYIDSTHNDTAIIGGIDGNVPARSIICLLNSDIGRDLLIGLNSYRQPYYIREEFYDASGTVSAGALGGEEVSLGVSTTALSGSGFQEVTINSKRPAYHGRETFIAFSLRDSGANLQVQGSILFSSTTFKINSEWKSITTDGTRRKFLVGPMVVPNGLDQLIPDQGFNKSGWLSYITWALYFKRTTGGSTPIYLDFYRSLSGKVTICEVAASSTQQIVLDGDLFLGYNSDRSLLYEQNPIRGQRIEFDPDKYNYMTVLSGALGDPTDHTGDTTGISMIQVAPRWKLL